MPKAWQWDVARSDKEIRQILGNPAHPSFIHYAALLLVRSNVPKEVFGGYLGREDFCRHWQRIKQRMLKDRSAHGRVQFWEEIYRHLRDDLKKKGVALRRPSRPGVPGSLRWKIGQRLREIRRTKKMTQAELAHGAGLTQQFVSNIERGTENISLDTLERLQKFLNEDLMTGI